MSSRRESRTKIASPPSTTRSQYSGTRSGAAPALEPAAPTR
ncbi:Uncharacterised protein [Mycobacteroides abscessus subsp. abscessus]|nr:Uncharacterised protein [Mycobacteroides abscessus subsp. abscessus]